MSLENLTVRFRRENGKNGKRYDSEVQVYNTERIVYAIPSISSREGATDGPTNAHVLISGGRYSGDIDLWVTQTVAEIEALDDA